MEQIDVIFENRIKLGNAKEYFKILLWFLNYIWSFTEWIYSCTTYIIKKAEFKVMLKYLSLLWALWWSLPTYCVKQKYWHTIYFHILRFWKLSPPSLSLLPPGPVSSFSYHFLFPSRPTSLLGGTFQWVQSRNRIYSLTLDSCFSCHLGSWLRNG